MLQYLGFTVRPATREYNFSALVKDSPGRAFTVVIDHSAFRHGLLKYQEGPGLCYGKLLAALEAETGDSPLCSRQQVTEGEASAYTLSGRAKGRKWTEEERLEARKRFNATRVQRIAR